MYTCMYVYRYIQIYITTDVLFVYDHYIRSCFICLMYKSLLLRGSPKASRIYNGHEFHQFCFALLFRNFCFFSAT
uniref:Uncharacterized protein n=1 Tax=Octopus bimaculoides TaxID=37653 RepID=A0A0L8GYL2_OCTBM